MSVGVSTSGDTPMFEFAHLYLTLWLIQAMAGMIKGFWKYAGKVKGSWIAKMMGLVIVTFMLRAAANQVEGRGTAIRAVPLNGGVDGVDGGMAKGGDFGIGGAHGAKDGWIDLAPTYRINGWHNCNRGCSRSVGVTSDRSAQSGASGRRPSTRSRHSHARRGQLDVSTLNRCGLLMMNPRPNTCSFRIHS